MTFLRSWALRLVSVSVLTAVAKQLCVKSPAKKVIGFICGTVMLTVLLSPLLSADTDAFSDALNSYRQAVSELTETAELQEKQLMRSYIEQKCAAYILDEAEELGAQLEEVKVRTKWREESWTPWEVWLKGVYDSRQRKRLSECLESELGIAAERQYWDEQDGS